MFRWCKIFARVFSITSDITISPLTPTPGVLPPVASGKNSSSIPPLPSKPPLWYSYLKRTAIVSIFSQSQLAFKPSLACYGTCNKCGNQWRERQKRNSTVTVTCLSRELPVQPPLQGNLGIFHRTHGVPSQKAAHFYNTCHDCSVY